jgi:TonB family protein
LLLKKNQGEVVHVKIDTNKGIWRDYTPLDLQNEKQVEKKVLQQLQQHLLKRKQALQQQWQNLLVEHIKRLKYVPEGIQAEGTFKVTFTIDREGNVVSSSLAQSSGVSAFDIEALDMIDRAQPMPKPPGEIPDDQLSFTFPVHFSSKEVG